MWRPRARGAARRPARCYPAGPGPCCGADARSARLRGHGGINSGHPPWSPPSPSRPPTLTVLVHAGLQALLEPAGLALVAVRLVHRAQPRPRLAPARRGGTRLCPQGWPCPPQGCPMLGALCPCWVSCPLGGGLYPANILVPVGVLSPMGVLFQSEPCPRGCPIPSGCPVPEKTLPCWVSYPNECHVPICTPSFCLSPWAPACWLSPGPRPPAAHL